MAETLAYEPCGLLARIAIFLLPHRLESLNLLRRQSHVDRPDCHRITSQWCDSMVARLRALVSLGISRNARPLANFVSSDLRHRPNGRSSPVLNGLDADHQLICDGLP